jgi:hypothetical protein
MTYNNARAAALSLALLALTCAAAGNAAEGNFEINQDCVAIGCFDGDDPGSPVTLAAAGHYVLTSNLAAPLGGANSAISITASGVDLDLNGNTIDGGGSCTGSPVVSCNGLAAARGVGISGAAAPSAHVHHGTIRGFGSGGIVGSPLASGSEFDHLLLAENSYGLLIVGESAQTIVRLHDSTILRNLQNGVTIANNIETRLEVDDCVISGNRLVGITVGTGSTLSNNRVTGNGGIGISCSLVVGGICALARNSLFANNGGGSANQWSISFVRDMGGNVCLDDNTCP